MIHECAYEHWHRMLFARFLAENGFLIEPESGLDVDFAHCEDEGKRQGIDLWEVAADYAQKMLLDVFRSDDPVMQARLPRQTRNALTALLNSLLREVFHASDSLGWVYQFWQAKKKEDVNASGVKIGADELPSVTQLFTEDYMVDFLLDNTLGAWWAGKRMKDEGGRMKFATEEEARQFVALPGCLWKYLRFIKVSPDGEAVDPTSSFIIHPSSLLWTPAAGTFDGWPKTAKELKCLDPCMGSGHFVVAMFERLVALRLAEEKLDEAAAVAAVIRDNLFGLEIDPRCTQIGAFNLALAAWRRVGHCKLPAMNLACSGLAPNTREADWLAIVDAVSSRTLKDKPERLEASATFAPINYFRPGEPVANLTGNLPHWRQEGTTYFVTFRCADALPQEKLHQWQQELAQWQAAHPEPHDDATRREFYERFPQRIQTWLDSGFGECVLREPVMREIVESALRHFDGQRYRLAEFVVAANHVHALVTPLGENLLSDILHSWKSFTANKINEARKKLGAFWQKESFDHIVRSPASLAKFREYIKGHAVQSLEGSSTVKVAAASSRISSPVSASSHSQPEGERLEAAATMRLRAGMERLYRLFQKAAVLGSLINPRAGEGDLLVAAFHELQPLLEKALEVEEASSLSSDQKRKSLEGSDTGNVAAASSRTGEEGKSLEGSATLHEMAVTARGLAKAAEILAGQFTLVATNVPYLGRGKQDDVLQDYCDRVYPAAKADLATCFVERCVEFCSVNGSTALVTPQNWWFLGTYRAIRAKLLTEQCVNVSATLGEEAWQSFGDRGPAAVLIVVGQNRPRPETRMIAIHGAPRRTISEKIAELKTGELRTIAQVRLYESKDHLITITEPASGALLGAFADCFQGVGSTDMPRFIQFFWEHGLVSADWDFYQMAPTKAGFSNLCGIIFWQQGGGDLSKIGTARKGLNAYGKRGVAVAVTRYLTVSHFLGNRFDCTLAALLPKRDKESAAIVAYVFSEEFREQVRKVDQAVSVTESSFVKVPFDLARWQKVATENYPDGLPKPFSNDPTQWLFNGHPKQIVAEASSLSSSQKDKSLEGSATLYVAVARLLGYQWPRQTGSSFPDCPALGSDGLEKHADKDGVVCFSQARDEAPAATRLRALLAEAYGNVEAASSRSPELRQDAAATTWSHALERKLIAATGSNAETLEDWLLNDFFRQHCEIFHNRPFVWHIWDGRKDGFNVLVNYHKLCGSGFKPLDSESKSEAGSLSHAGHRTLETLTYAYLGDWIARQKDGVAHGEAGADDRLAAALELQGLLKSISAGEPPYDLFIRWKALACQPIGWEPDINDGVRLNIRPFLAVDLSRGKKGAGLFRAKFNVKWDKDRGKEPKRPKEDFPWFWSWDEQTVDFKGNGEFDGSRWNDCHFTTAFKCAARERKAYR